MSTTYPIKSEEKLKKFKEYYLFIKPVCHIRIKYSVQNRRPFKFTVAGCIQREKELLQGSYMHHGAEDRKRTKCGSQCQRFRCFVYFTGKGNP